MFVGHLLLLPLALCFASGFKLSENEWKTNNDTSQRDRIDSPEAYEEDEQVFPSNASVSPWNELVDIWSPYLMAKLWHRDARESLNISAACGKDVTDYIAALSARKQWALKMADATGRHSWGLLSGNMLWVGSPGQCRRMASEFLQWQKDKEAQRKKHLPPFLVSMNAATLSFSILHTAELNKTYSILMGLCLPDSCSPEDVKELFHFVQGKLRNDSSTKVVVELVRNLSNGYSFWEDPVFYVLAVTFVVVIVFVILATFYDISLRYRVLRMAKERHGKMVTEMKLLNSDRVVDDEITLTKLWSVTEHNATLDLNNSEKVAKPLSEALLSFSLLLNLSKMFSLEVGADTLAPIHGLKFITMLWIILIHTCMSMSAIADDSSFRLKAEEDFFYQAIGNGTYSVDTFFFISGCLVSFLYFRTVTNEHIRKKSIIQQGCCGQVLQFIGTVLYRYFRLTPPYLLLIGLTQVSLSWYYEHTMFDLLKRDYQNCRRFWWRNALYINAYFSYEEQCMMWSWYLTNDTLFYIIGIIILIIGARFIPVAAFMTISVLIASWITTAVIALNEHHVPSIQDPFAHYDSLYDKPWLRIGPYVLGMITGWYLYKSNCKLKIHTTVALLLWALSCFTMFSIVYGLYGSGYGPFVSTLYTALSHSGWAASLSWILIACVCGHGGVVNKVLSCKYLYPLSRLSYCVYLLHPAIIRAVLVAGEHSLHLSEGFVTIMFLGFTVASYAVGLFISLLFEAPMVSLLRIVHPLRQWKKE
ncbi:O-acyltransferase like protein-like [Andrena cerasifolii]|uniref:O-acyltransferase like protein-like n=1 Tax=Andrena cerasifolii TaxID=2819439 RepID=UPI00403774FA